MTREVVLSFLRMQESPSSATLGDSCIRRNDRNEAFEIASFPFLPFCFNQHYFK
ncbi:MAG: hypothetical protein NT007_01940 [Candidatus Kapabacteria bacterium]|nr:hypothetical protein [Candidatus Kapabacteria bacterium]